MTTLLNDVELKKLVGSVIVNGDQDCIRQNSYVLRVGSHGEYLNTEKLFEIGKLKKGIKIPPGHSVGFTLCETSNDPSGASKC